MESIINSRVIMSVFLKEYVEGRYLSVYRPPSHIRVFPNLSTKQGGCPASVSLNHLWPLATPLLYYLSRLLCWPVSEGSQRERYVIEWLISSSMPTFQADGFKKARMSLTSTTISVAASLDPKDSHMWTLERSATSMKSRTLSSSPRRVGLPRLTSARTEGRGDGVDSLSSSHFRRTRCIFGA
jgi:hypothetical protein